MVKYLLQLTQQAEENRAMQSYVHAAEGFLQVLEKTAEQFEEEGRDYIVDDVATVGRLLVECAQHGKQWNELTGMSKALLLTMRIFSQKTVKNELQELVEARGLIYGNFEFLLPFHFVSI